MAEPYRMRAQIIWNTPITMIPVVAKMIERFIYTPWLASRTWGRRRAGTLCYWYGYDTILNFRGAYFDVKIVINGITRHFITSIDDYYGTAEEREKQIWDDFQTGPITWQGGTPPAISFTRAFVEASSRGTNNNWVSVDCIGPQ